MPPIDLETTEARAAAAGGAEKRAYVRRIFSEIAPRYDLLNHLLSFNIDRRWRRRAIAILDPTRRPGGVFVDLCAGTLDVAAELSRTRGFRGLVLGTDFADQDGDEQDRRLDADPAFKHALYKHACEGCYGAPEYGGNRDLAGWRAIQFAGDVQPRGYTDEEVSGRA